MSSNEPRVPNLPIDSTEVPDDVRAELDTEERRMQAEPVPAGSRDAVPEDVPGERDREAPSGQEEVRGRLAEGRPPAEEEARS
ncbi:MAG: hypothetical protein M3069_04290 [Chloroflexota bacterium]|nr:hypothetical protein [Chloroflexota bacterium]